MFNLLRKEVIQPHLPIRLPCYDLALLTNHTLDAFPPYGLEESVLGAVNSGGLTGGVYKTRERIHRTVSDMRLLAIPASRGRIAALDLNWPRFFEICSTLRSCFSL